MHDLLADMLDQRFGIEHATLQVESKAEANHGGRTSHN